MYITPQDDNTYLISGSVTLQELVTLKIPDNSTLDLRNISAIEDLAVIFLRDVRWKVLHPNLQSWNNTLHIVHLPVKLTTSYVDKPAGIGFFSFLKKMFQNLKYSRLAEEETWSQINSIARKSLISAVFVGVLLGVAVAMQFLMYVERFGLGLEHSAPNIFAFIMSNHLGPLIGAQIFSSQYSSAISSDITTFRSNEEWDALISMGHNPYECWCWPRVYTSVIMTTSVVIVVTISLLLSSAAFTSFWLPNRSLLEIILITKNQLGNDIGFMMMIVRGLIFGLSISVISAYKSCSFNVVDGIGKCTTECVYFSALSIIVCHVVISMVSLWI